MKIIIHPYEGIEIEDIGMIRFGMNREEVRSFFDEEPKYIPSQKKDSFSEHYRQSLIMAHFHNNEQLYGLNFAESDHQLVFLDKSLWSMSYIEIRSLLEQLDPQAIEDSLMESFDSSQYGLSIGIAYPEEDGINVKTPWVYVYERGTLN